MPGSASALWIRPASSYPACEVKAAIRSLPGSAATTTRTCPSQRPARFVIRARARPGSSRSASSMITTTGTDTDTAATALAARATAPSSPAGAASHALPAAVKASDAIRTDAAAASPDTNRPPTPRASCTRPADASRPSSSARRDRIDAVIRASRNATACTATPGGMLPSIPTTRVTGAPTSWTTAWNWFRTAERPHAGGTASSTTREPIPPHRSSRHPANSAATASCRPDSRDITQTLRALSRRRADCTGWAWPRRKTVPTQEHQDPGPPGRATS